MALGASESAVIPPRLTQEELAEQLLLTIRDTMPNTSHRRGVLSDVGRRLSRDIEENLTATEGACVAAFYLFVALGGDETRVFEGEPT